MAKTRRSYIYSRKQGGEVRYYGDFREFADVGGKREALVPKGAHRATSDSKLAQDLVTARLADLEARRRRKQRREPEEDTFLAAYAIYHLRKKRQARKTTTQWLEAAQNHLEAAIQFFCNGGESLPRDPVTDDAILTTIEDRELASIDVLDVQAYTEWLAQRPNGRVNEKLSPSSQRKYLNSLSNLFKRAISEGRVPPSHNPVAALMDKPQDGTDRGESHWLEVPDAALLLESARVYQPKRPDAAIEPHVMYALVATFLLTGGRPDEVYGLHVEDISFERSKLTLRPNTSRGRTKTAGSVRVVRMWPQLREILSEYVELEGSPKSGLLFRSRRTDGKIDDIRKALDTIATAAGWKAGDIRPYAFRHTYCAARLQTLDAGYPVSQFTVAKELGHGGDALVKKVYGHLGEVRHRSEVVEYRVEQHIGRLSERLRALRELKVA